jgi:hypothetical protein
MKTRTFVILICLSLSFATSLVAQPNTPAKNASAQTPAIPEEARKHFVMGTTLFKEAKTADDFTQVEGEFKQAADLAPQWPDARYNLALAKEAAGDYSGAMADLKLYQQFKLSDTEARTVQDKIYALEAKAGLAAKKQAEEQKAAAVNEQKPAHYTYTFYDEFSDNHNGWPLSMQNCVFAIEDGRLSMNALGSPSGRMCFINKEFPIYRTKEFELEVTGKWESGRVGSPYGILFCANARRSSYMFGITAGGFYGISSKENDGEWKEIAVEANASVNQSDSPNVLKIVKKGESIMFYANNTLLKTLPIEGYGTTFGMFANNGTKIQFSKFKLSGEKQ